MLTLYFRSVVIFMCSELADTMNKCGPAVIEGCKFPIL